MGGNGSLSEEDSRELRDAAVTFASRTGSPESKTSPEELIASAHATCYAMALSNTLAEQDAPPVRLKVDVVCILDDEQLKITTVNIEVRGEVSGQRRGVPERRPTGRADLPRLQRPEEQRRDPGKRQPRAVEAVSSQPSAR